jgi:hypothetical protein
MERHQRGNFSYMKVKLSGKRTEKGMDCYLTFLCPFFVQKGNVTMIWQQNLWKDKQQE